MPKGSASHWHILTLTAVGLFVVLVTLRIERETRNFRTQLLVAQSGSESSSSAVSESSSTDAPPPVSSAASSKKEDVVVPIEPGSCSAVKPDPVTGQKLIYCCLDEIYTYQKEANEAEAQQFMQRLDEVQKMPASQALEVFDAGYDSSVHRKYNWTSLCGRKVPCDICSANHICGNGVKEAEEKCDDGPLNSDDAPDRCRLDCSLPKCGDSVTDVKKGEECDDGPGNSNKLPNACRVSCKRPSCGDRVIDSDLGETCDAGPANSDTAPNSCRTDCHLAFCGDSVMDRGEECDDGNAADGDGCSARCAVEEKEERIEVQCGNGVVDAGEECDTGQMNANVPDACRLSCRRPTCGDGIRDSNEECDDNNMASGDGCSAACLRELQLSLTKECGDGTIDEDEECDAGGQNANIPDACRSDCLFPVCGDGITDSGEQCDDGNLVNGDGCNDRCFSEFCGDALVRMGEECDDGNLISGDGCDALCRKEIPKVSQTETIVTASSAAAASSVALRPVAPPPLPPALVGTQSSSLFLASAATALTLQEEPAIDGIPPPLPITASPNPYEPAPPAPIASVLPQEWTMSETGPAALSIIAMGAAAGLAWMRRRKQ